jgi:hypothetical protein
MVAVIICANFVESSTATRQPPEAMHQETVNM